MSNDIQIFNSPQFGQIRTAGTQDAPLFCLVDVCKALELTPSKVSQRLGDDVLSKYPIQDELNRTQQANFVNEDGLYDVILDSRKPEAKAFRKWITSEVLPTIRQHGAYMTEDALTRAIAEPDFLIQLATALKEEKAKRLSVEQVCEEQRAQIAESDKEILALSSSITEMQPKVSYYDRILASKATLTVTQVAQDYGMSAKAFNVLLRNFHIQHKVNGQWILYAQYLQNGYVHSKSVEITRKDGTMDTKNNTEWTQKGRLFLYDTLKSNNILPLIER